MRVRMKFVLILTLVVSIILVSSIFIIYTLFAHTRKQEFEKRLWAHAYSNFLVQYNVVDTSKSVAAKLENYLPGYPLNLQTILIDSSFHVTKQFPIDLNFNIDTALLKNVRQQKEFDFSVGSQQAVGLYIEKDGISCYSIAIGYDKYGISRLSSLKVIMVMVATGAIIAVGLFALFYVIIVTRPLVSLSVQMRKIGETNLSQRVRLTRGNVRNNEIVQIASNFNEMLDRLEKAFQMQRNFVHHASHDLRTPLATMLSQTESALRKDLSPEDARKVLESLKEDQLGMIELSNSLLLLAQYENLNFSPDWPMVRLDEIIYDTMMSAKKLLPDIKIVFNYAKMPDDESLLSVRGNETLLRAAFMNIIKNAYKYSDNRSLNIIMELLPDAILIHFENTGRTINEDDADRIFLPFFRSEQSKNEKGFGLGLSIVKRITEIHNSNISYRAVDGIINRFTFRFEKI